MHESTRAPSLSVARILALPQRVLSTHISLRALARRTRFRRSIPETPGFALGSNVRHSASLIASGRSMPPHPVSCSCCIGINAGFMLILHWTILLHVSRHLPCYHSAVAWNSWFRSRRMRRFAREMHITAETRVLDVGGTPETWDMLPVRPRVTLLNTPRTKAELAGASSWVAGDGRILPFRDEAFDVVFSNSVIEHVGDAPGQRRFAHEGARVGCGDWGQTPNRWFPVEQHLLTPLVHWLPKPWQAFIVPRFTVWDALVRPSPDRRAFYLAHYLEDVRLLSAAELAALFPDARLIRERLCGWTKSLVAVRPYRDRKSTRLNS